MNWVGTVFFEDVFENTIMLLNEVKQLVEKNMEKKIVNVDINEVKIKSSNLEETKLLSGLTVCLTSITSWLILNKAFNAGEIAREKLIEEGNGILALINKQNDGIFFVEKVDVGINDIIKKSQKLFENVKELFAIVENNKI